MNAYHQGQLDFFCAIYAFINAMRLLFGLQLLSAREILAGALEEIAARPLLWEALLRNRTDHHWIIPYLLGRYCGPGGLPVRAARLPAQPLPERAGVAHPELADRLGLARPDPVELDGLDEADLYRPELEFGPHMEPPLSRPEAPHRDWPPERLWPLLQDWLPHRGLMSVFGQAQRQERCLLLRFHRFVPYQHLPIVCHWSTGLDFHKDTLNLYDCTASKEATHALPISETALYPEDLDTRHYLALEPQSIWFLEKI